ncbi:MAG: zinc transporter ZupT [Candidatus Riflebacteria bacterium]|nr:zinc transporter ZupT [Candidatus Riflebacteria bacterium]
MNIDNNVLYALSLTLFAGLSTGVGSLIALFSKKTNPKFLSFSLGFSAGVMIYVSMVEILVKSKEALVVEYGLKTGSWASVISFFAGIAVIGIIDKLVPEEDNPHEFHHEEGQKCVPCEKAKLLRSGLFTALAIAIHNFPEGIATFVAALADPTIAIPVAVAVAIHNIPEGIAVSVPVHYATGSRRKAFWYSFLSGLSEPIGAILAYLVLMPFLNNVLFGVIFGIVAGIMVYISLDELLPTAREYGEHHISMSGLVAGMALMAVSLLLFI